MAWDPTQGQGQTGNGGQGQSGNGGPEPNPDKDNLATVGQNLIQIIMLHKILMKDRDNLPVEQTHIQDMVLHRTPTVLRTLTAHHLRKTPMVLLLHNTVSHLISRVATDMDMHPHSKRLDQ